MTTPGAIAVVLIMLLWLAAGATAQAVRAGDLPALDVTDLSVIPFAFVALSMTWSVLLAVRGVIMHTTIMLLWGLGFVACVWFFGSFPGLAPVAVTFAFVGAATVVATAVPGRPFWLSILGPAAAAFLAILSELGTPDATFLSESTLVLAFVAATGVAHMMASWQTYTALTYAGQDGDGTGETLDTAVRAVGAQVTVAVDAFRGLSRFDMLA